MDKADRKIRELIYCVSQGRRDRGVTFREGRGEGFPRRSRAARQPFESTSLNKDVALRGASSRDAFARKTSKILSAEGRRGGWVRSLVRAGNGGRNLARAMIHFPGSWKPTRGARSRGRARGGYIAEIITSEKCNRNPESPVSSMNSVIDVAKFNSARGRLGGETYIKLRLKAHITRDVTLPHLGSGATKVRSTF